MGTFFLFGATMWAQVIVGWRWEPPTGRGVAVGMWLMSVAAVVTALLGLLAAAPIGWSIVHAQTVGARRRLLGPMAQTAAGGVILAVGSHHFRSRWPGTGGHVWAYHRLVPGDLGATVWSATRGVSVYWLHPSQLASFRLAEVAWMAISPVAIVMVVVGMAKAIRRVELSPAVWRIELALARVAMLVALVFMAGAAAWVLGRNPPGPTGIYRVGTIDVLGLAVMACAWVAGWAAAHSTST
jgi:hypothetical protein